jgi:hypothetical protein
MSSSPSVASRRPRDEDEEHEDEGLGSARANGVQANKRQRLHNDAVGLHDMIPRKCMLIFGSPKNNHCIQTTQVAGSGLRVPLEDMRSMENSSSPDPSCESRCRTS